MTYNVHSCVGTDGVRSTARVAEVIASTDADVVCLQELDRMRPRSERIPQAEVIARELTMHFHFHPALRLAEEEYGDAILSKHPLRLQRAADLPHVPTLFCRETRGALWVTVSAYNLEWQIVNTHFGLGRAERLAQATALLGPEWIGAASRRPRLVVCGDFNSHPGGRVHRLLRSGLRDTQAGWHRRTFPSCFPLVCLDYIFTGPNVNLQRLSIVRTPLARVASDHLPLIAEFDSAQQSQVSSAPER